MHVPRNAPLLLTITAPGYSILMANATEPTRHCALLLAINFAEARFQVPFLARDHN
jgi:hypothetical protein